MPFATEFIAIDISLAVAMSGAGFDPSDIDTETSISAPTARTGEPSNVTETEILISPTATPKSPRHSGDRWRSTRRW